ncbi:MAG: SRPBCC family protein [Acidobacteria bacterium]|nr:SRPBCC family protein [Acidobacteriota bacterium]
MAEDYEFVTVWRFDAPLARVWEEIKNSETWSDWWKGVLRVEKLRDGDASGVGAVHRSTWRSALPYKLIFDSETVRVEEPHVIEVRAFGELDGQGIWTLTAEDENVTRVRYDWRVRTTKRWMNLLAPVAKPFFRWNHDTIMNWGGRGLARKLGCQLLENR